MSKGSHLKGRGPWSEAEDEILRNYVNEHGAGSWKSVVENSGLKRDAQSCRLRWGSYLDPNVDRSPFTEAEDRMILRMVSWEGSTNWVGIATSAFPTHTGYQLQGRWHMLMNKMRKAQGGGRSPARLEHGPGSAERGGRMLKREWSQDIRCPRGVGGTEGLIVASGGIAAADRDVPSGRTTERDHHMFPPWRKEERDGRGGAGWEEGRSKRQREGTGILQSEETVAKRQVEEGDWLLKQMETSWGGSGKDQQRLTGGTVDRWREVVAREGWDLRGLLTSTPGLGESVDTPVANELDLNLSLRQNNSGDPGLGSKWGKGGGKRSGSSGWGRVEEEGGGGERREHGGDGEAADLELRLFTESGGKERERVPKDTGAPGADLDSLAGGRRSSLTLRSPCDLHLAPTQHRNPLGVGSNSGGLGLREEQRGLPRRAGEDLLLSVPPCTSFRPIARSMEIGWSGYDQGGSSPLPAAASTPPWRRPSDVAASLGEEVKQSVVLHADTGVPLEDLTPTSGPAPALDFGKRQVSPSPWATVPGMSLELSRAMSAVGLSSSTMPWSASPQLALTSARSTHSSLVSSPSGTVDSLWAASPPMRHHGGGGWSMLGVNAGSMPDLLPTLEGGMSRSTSLTHMPSPLSQAGTWMVGAEAWRQRARFRGMGSNDQAPLGE